MSFLRVFAVAAFAALFAVANANPQGYGAYAYPAGFGYSGLGGYGFGGDYGFGGYGYGGPGAFGAWGYGGLGAGYGAGYGHNLNAALGNAGLTIDFKGSEATLAGVAPHATLPVAETLAIPTGVALPPGRTIGCGAYIPKGFSVPVGLPFAGLPTSFLF